MSNYKLDSLFSTANDLISVLVSPFFSGELFEGVTWTIYTYGDRFIVILFPVIISAALIYLTVIMKNETFTKPNIETIIGGTGCFFLTIAVVATIITLVAAISPGLFLFTLCSCIVCIVIYIIRALYAIYYSIKEKITERVEFISITSDTFEKTGSYSITLRSINDRDFHGSADNIYREQRGYVTFRNIAGEFILFSADEFSKKEKEELMTLVGGKPGHLTYKRSKKDRRTEFVSFTVI